MKCPFCNSELDYQESAYYHEYACIAKECINDDMPRYIVKYHRMDPKWLVTSTFMMEDLYIQVDHQQNYTVISKLEACVLFDSVQIPKALDIDLKDPFAILPKIRTLMTFS